MIVVKNKLRAFSLHLIVSVILAAMSAALVFYFWFPYPYREISGGRELFSLIVMVDVILGPLITFVVFNPSKSRKEKILDFSVIGFLQLGALLYGLWSVAQARPVYMVFEYNRLRVVHVADVPPELLDKAGPPYQTLPMTKAGLLSLRPMAVAEQMQMTMGALSGLPLAARPELWQPYDSAHSEILEQSKPAKQLLEQFAQQAPTINAAIAETGRPVAHLRYLPLLSRGTVWTALIDAESALPVGFAAVDPLDK
jgi:hypothetical protein